MPLSAYHTADGYPPGRWLGDGLAGLNDGAGVGLVDEVGMQRLFALGLDPVTDAPLGESWPLHKTPPNAARPASSHCQPTSRRPSASPPSRRRRTAGAHRSPSPGST